MNLPAMSKGGALEEGKKKRLQQKWLVRYIRKVILNNLDVPTGYFWKNY
jgi:hypothetical protein